MVRRRLDLWWPDPSEYMNCSIETQKIAETLAYYRTSASGDVRTANYYPLLDDIVDWMDDFYGK